VTSVVPLTHRGERVSAGVLGSFRNISERVQTDVDYLERVVATATYFSVMSTIKRESAAPKVKVVPNVHVSRNSTRFPPDHSR
jgi:hypothetical protein